MNELKDIFTSYWNYLPLAKACKWNVFDSILEGFHTEELVAQKMGWELKATSHFLSTLEYLSVLHKVDNKYHLTEKGMVLTESHPKSLKYACILWSEEHLNSWQNMETTLKTGQPSFEFLYGHKFFDYISSDKDKLKIYHKAIAEYARDDYEKIADLIDLSPYGVIMDLGGGIGELLHHIRIKFPSKRLILFDRKEVLEISRYSDIEVLEGNFFSDIPRVADCIFLSRVLHDWNDQDAKRILHNVNICLPEKGSLIIVENSIDQENLPATLNLNMQIMTGSHERTEKEFRNLLEESSFTISEIYSLNSLLKILLCQKK